MAFSGPGCFCLLRPGHLSCRPAQGCPLANACQCKRQRVRWSKYWLPLSGAWPAGWAWLGRGSASCRLFGGPRPLTGNERGQRIAFPCCWYHRLSLRRPKARPPRTGQTDLLFPNARPPTASAVMLSVVRYIAPSPLAASCRCPEESGTVTGLAVCFFRDLQGCDERWLMGKSRSRLRGGGGRCGRGCGYGAARSQCCITCNTAKGGGGGGGAGACQCRVWRRRHGHARPSALSPCFALSRAPKENKATSPTRQGPSARVSLASQSTERGGAWGGPPRGRSESGCIPISQGASAAAAAASLLLFWGARVRVVGLA